MTSKEKIIVLYYEKKLNTIEISDKIHVSKQYVSKIIKTDNRYIEEKQRRKALSIQKQKERNIACINKTRARKSDDSEREFAAMKLLQIQDACEMSGRKTINNRAFRNWNSSIYQYHNRTKEYRIRKDFENKVSYAVPKKIKWN